jgi:nucleoid-associated protein YejK
MRYEQLKTQLTNLTQAKGGYFLFVEYQSIANFLAVFILRNTKGFISKNESDHFEEFHFFIVNKILKKTIV